MEQLSSSPGSDGAALLGPLLNPFLDALDGLAGKTIGFIDNAKPNFNNLVDELAELLVNKYHVAKVIKRSKFTPSIPASGKLIDELVAECDAVIAGSGD